MFPVQKRSYVKFMYVEQSTICSMQDSVDNVHMYVPALLVGIFIYVWWLSVYWFVDDMWESESI